MSSTSDPKAPKPKASRHAPADDATQSAAVPYASNDPHAAWTHFRPEALLIAPELLTTCTGNIDVMRHNVGVAVASIAPLAARVRKDLPSINLTRALEAPALALALSHAADQVVGAAPTPAAPGERPADDAELPLAERTKRMFADRALLVAMLRIFVGLGDDPAASLAKILEDSGPIVGARDVLTADTALDLPKLAGRHPFSDAWRATARARARGLLTDLTPANAVVAPKVADPAALERDAFYKLLQDAHGDLRKIGIVFFGEKGVDARVPPLAARVAANPTPVAVVTDGSPATPAPPKKKKRG